MTDRKNDDGSAMPAHKITSGPEDVYDVTGFWVAPDGVNGEKIPPASNQGMLEALGQIGAIHADMHPKPDHADYLREGREGAMFDGVLEEAAVPLPDAARIEGPPAYLVRDRDGNISIARGE